MSLGRNLLDYKIIVKAKSIGFLCNQSSFNFEHTQYNYKILDKKGSLHTIFIPEHGLFTELQDQIKQDNKNLYEYLDLNAHVVSLYQSSSQSIFITSEQISDLDLFIIDIQDIGSRYYTYLFTIYHIIRIISRNRPDLKIVVLDRPNPAGRQVEGSPLKEIYGSFIGLHGLPHRHGLTIGEISLYFNSTLETSADLEIIPYDSLTVSRSPFISSSTNISHQSTINLYSGSCLIEGTQWSEGRGTTLPFELLGSPSSSWQEINKIKRRFESTFPEYKSSFRIRPLIFSPTFHKHCGKSCYGMRLHLLDPRINVLLCLVRLIAIISDETAGNLWRPGSYEYGSSKTAIELLAGDDIILNYLYTRKNSMELASYLRSKQEQWISLVSKHRLYNTELYSAI